MIKAILKKIINSNDTKETSLFENLTVDTMEKNDINQIKENVIEEFLKNPNKRFKSASEQGEYFEKFIATVFELAGYNVVLTPIHDKGIDVFAEKKGERYIIQCKNYNIINDKVKLVGESEVREFNGVVEKGKKILITTSYFTGYVSKKDFSNIIFIDRIGIPLLIKEILPEIYDKYEKECKENFSGQICEVCNKGIMVNKEKNNKRVLLGCSNFPNCKNMENKSFHNK